VPVKEFWKSVNIYEVMTLGVVGVVGVLVADAPISGRGNFLTTTIRRKYIASVVFKVGTSWGTTTSLSTCDMVYHTWVCNADPQNWGEPGCLQIWQNEIPPLLYRSSKQLFPNNYKEKTRCNRLT